MRPEWGAILEAHDAAGTIVMFDPDSNTRHVFNPDRAETRFSPASTFKIYNSLVALETGVVPNVDTFYVWDGVERGGSWDQDQSLRTGLQRSVVWLFQELAEQIGRERYEEAFAREPYGNNLVGEDVRMFWLGEPLEISATEQVAFLNQLRNGALAFRPEVQESVREMMILEDEDGYSLSGKTGWTWTEEDRSDEVGWIVGWVDSDDQTWIYALNVEPNGPGFDMGSARREILEEVLVEMGVRLPLD